MYYYYILKNWIICKYYNVFGNCVNINKEYKEPLLNETYEEDNKIKKSVYGVEFQQKFNDDSDNKLLI